MYGSKWRSARTWNFLRFLSLRNNMMQQNMQILPSTHGRSFLLSILRVFYHCLDPFRGWLLHPVQAHKTNDITNMYRTTKSNMYGVTVIANPNRM